MKIKEIDKEFVLETTTDEYPRVINNLEYNYKENPGEINTLQSETVPNQAFTVTEVLLRFSQGTLPNIVQPVYYDDTDDFDNIDPTLDPAFDMVDADNILNQIENNKKEREEKKLNQNSPEPKSTL